MATKLHRFLSYQVRRISLRPAIAILTFLIGVGLSAVLFFVSHQDKRTDNPVLQMVSVCDVARTPTQYESKLVKIQGALVGFHELVLYDQACKSEGNYIRVDLDQSSRTELGEQVSKFENKGLREGNFWLHVVLVGRLESVADGNQDTFEKEFPHPRPIHFRARLVVSSIEKVSPFDGS